MQVGVTIPNNWGVADPREVLELGVLAEQQGFDSVWVMDHLFHTGFVSERLGERPYYHPLSILSALAPQTERLILGTSVMVLPYHDPVELAKYVATLDHLSRGRFVLGIGAGGLEPEFEALGVPVRERGRRTDESIAIMHELWTNPDPSFEGQQHTFAGVQFWPKPHQQPHPPVWVGGNSPGAKRRAARMGNAWHPNSVSPEEYAPAAAEIRERAAEAGRDSDAIQMTVRLELALPGATGDRAHRSGLAAMESEAVVDRLGQYAEAGVDHVVLSLGSGDVALLREVMQSLAVDVAPRV